MKSQYLYQSLLYIKNERLPFVWPVIHFYLSYLRLRTILSSNQLLMSKINFYSVNYWLFYSSNNHKIERWVENIIQLIIYLLKVWFKTSKNLNKIQIKLMKLFLTTKSQTKVGLTYIWCQRVEIHSSNNLNAI
jgi:hypothetical protein